MDEQSTQLDNILSQLKTKGASPDEMSQVAKEFLNGGQAPAPTGPLSQVVPEMQKYAVTSPDDYMANIQNEFHPIVGINKSDFLPSDTTPAPIQGLKLGLKIAAAPINIVSDVATNIIPGAFKLASDALRFGWAGVKDTAQGLWTGDFNYSDVQDVYDTSNVVKPVVENPLNLVPFAKPLVYSINQAYQDAQSGKDYKTIITDVAQGIQNSGVTFMAAPFSNYAAMKMVGGLTDAALHPVDTLNSAKNLPETIKTKAIDTAGKIKNAYEAITDPTEFVKTNYPTIWQSWTETGLNDLRQKNVNSIQDINESLTSIGELTDLSKLTEKLSTEDSINQTKLNNAYQDLESQAKAASMNIQAQLKALNIGAELAAPEGTLNDVFNGLQNFLQNEKDVTKSSFTNMLSGRLVNDYSPLIDSLNRFTNEVASRNNPELVDYLNNYKTNLTDNVLFKKLWEDSNNKTNIDKYGNPVSPDMAFRQKVAEYANKNKLTNDFVERGAEYAQNPGASKFRLPTLSELKSEDFNNAKFNNLINNATGGAKDLFNKTITAAREALIQKELSKTGEHNQYAKSNSQWSFLKQIGDLINNDYNTSKSIETAIRNNYSKIKSAGLDQLANIIENYFTSKILKEAGSKTGYDPKAILDGVEKYRDVLDPSTRKLLTEHADYIDDMQNVVNELNKQKQVVGTTPVEVIENIGKIKEVKDLENISKITGLKPEELGNAYLNAIKLKNEAKIGQIENLSPEDTVKSFTSQINEITKKFDFKSPESQPIIDALFPKETQTLIKNAESLLEKYEVLRKAKGRNPIKSAATIAIAALAYSYGHLIIGTGLVKSALTGDASLKPALVKSESFKTEGGKIFREESKNTTKTPKAKRVSKILKTIFNPETNINKVGAVSSNASNKDRGNE